MRPYFYPRSPYGERLNPQFTANQIQIISIHALLTESDVMHTLKFADLMLFLSTLSLRRATVLHQTQKRTQPFLSTLSLRRATLFPLLRNLLHHHFYPRSPYGERLKKLSVANGRMEFLSTLSLRRATRNISLLDISSAFLSTLSLRRATKPNKHQNLPRRFLSTLSLRRATFEKFEGVIATKISIHALLTESDSSTSL